MRADEDQLREWMIGGLDGNAADHTRLLRAIVPILTTFFRRRMNESADVEDMIQDTLIAVHTRRETYDRQRSFTPWLFSIARYKMIDNFRRNRRTVPIEDLEEILVSEGFEDAVSARVDIDVLLTKIPEKQARLIRATRIAGSSIAEVSAAESLGESDVKVSVHRGIKSLAARVAKRL